MRIITHVSKKKKITITWSFLFFIVKFWRKYFKTIFLYFMFILLWDTYAHMPCQDYNRFFPNIIALYASCENLKIKNDVPCAVVTSRCKSRNMWKRIRTICHFFISKYRLFSILILLWSCHDHMLSSWTLFAMWCFVSRIKK